MIVFQSHWRRVTSTPDHDPSFYFHRPNTSAALEMANGVANPQAKETGRILASFHICSGRNGSSWGSTAPQALEDNPPEPVRRSIPRPQKPDTDLQAICHSSAHAPLPYVHFVSPSITIRLKSTRDIATQYAPPSASRAAPDADCTRHGCRAC